MTNLLIWLLAFLALVFIAYAVVQAFNKRQTKQIQLEGIQLLKHISQLISDSQKHRGVSIAYIKGNKAVASDIRELQRAISDSSRQLLSNQQFSQLERWSAYQVHWQRLEAKVFDLSAENAFQQHTRLVANLLFLLEDVAEKYRLSSEYLSALPIANLLWRELVQIAECIGQSRALGTGAATAKMCSSVEKIQLGFLHSKITDVADLIFNELSHYSDSIQDRELAALIDYSRQLTTTLCLTIEQELLQPKVVDIDADEYFSLATKTINAINRVFTSQLSRLEQLVS